MLMADQADAELASPGAATAVKGLNWYDCCDLPLGAFLLEVGPAGVLEGGYDQVDGVVPGLTISSTCRPLVVVSEAGTKSLLKGVFKTFLWCLSVTMGSGEFTIQDYLGQAPPLFWRYTLPSVAMTSATWPLCWWTAARSPMWRKSHEQEMTRNFRCSQKN